MGMTIDESIDVLKEHLRILNVDKGIEFWQEIEALEVALDTMRKYQKIEQIIGRPTGNNAEEKAYNYMMIVKDIKEVLEDGNSD